LNVKRALLGIITPVAAVVSALVAVLTFWGSDPLGLRGDRGAGTADVSADVAEEPAQPGDHTVLLGKKAAADEHHIRVSFVERVKLKPGMHPVSPLRAEPGSERPHRTKTETYAARLRISSELDLVPPDVSHNKGVSDLSMIASQSFEVVMRLRSVFVFHVGDEQKALTFERWAGSGRDALVFRVRGTDSDSVPQ